MKRNLVFTRKASLRGIAMKYAILLDGKEVGRLGSGQALRIPVTEGSHTLILKPHPGFMLETFGPYTVIVGKRDVDIWVDTSNDPFVCKITGSENESNFPAAVNGMCQKLMDLTLAEAGRNLPCSYLMKKDRVILGRIYNPKDLMEIFYSELSDYTICKLEPWEQREMAKTFGAELYLSGRMSQACVHVSGISVRLDPN